MDVIETVVTQAEESFRKMAILNRDEVDNDAKEALALSREIIGKEIVAINHRKLYLERLADSIENSYKLSRKQLIKNFGVENDS